MFSSKYLAPALIAGALALSAAPAGAVTFVSGSPQSLTISYDGYDGSPVAGLSAGLQLNFLGTEDAGKSYRFSYMLTNSSSADSQLTVFGFNIDPEIGSVTTGAGNLFDQSVIASGGTNVPNFVNVNFCLKDSGNANNCASGQGNSGVADGSSASGEFTLKYSSAPANVSLTDFFVRYQSIDGIPGVSSAVGRGTVEAPVPEPATWAMMIAGFGLVGGAMRRRKPIVRFA